MAIDIPYLQAPTATSRILEKIKEAATPEIFSQDFLKTKLGFNGGNYLSFIPWAKKAQLLNQDGTPTQLYKKFRNSSTSSISLATALKNAYKELYTRNEYCHLLEKKAFKGLVMEATGDSQDSARVEKIVNTFFNVKPMADFETSQLEKSEEKNGEKAGVKSETVITKQPAVETHAKKLALGLNYTINLVLPKTDDPAIYNAIFKSLKENLLND